MMHPLISVITVTRNALPDLKATLESIDSQTSQSLEMVVVDGASTDGTPLFLQSYQCHHPLMWLSEPDQGIYDAMNKGISMAKGDYCIFMNAADTFVNPNIVDSVIQSGMEADVVYGDIVKNGMVKPALSPHNSHKMYYCHQAAFTRTACLRQYPFDLSHPYSADFKQSKLLYLNHHSFQHLPFPVAYFDTHGVSNTQRSVGLLDNIHVIQENDHLLDQLRLLPRLYFSYFVCRLRGK